MNKIKPIEDDCRKSRLMLPMDPPFDFVGDMEII